ncbi:ABC transporter permease [Paenibacillus piri]|uniref:Sugar ABC transporter permease n=1 Tax=Paenibacillus piri TaxID=2547395 RepID=A0A4R5KWF5_9BACL|nr:ABC transporter permease subunit [Paenibacillus piri]TDF99508.1 sugar ABC transporter permease [Paenibacillus piri]
MRSAVLKNLYRSRYLYLMIAPVAAYYIIFDYIPMYGAQIAFRDFNPFVGVWGSQWVGLKYFEQFFSSVYFTRLLGNTLMINLYALLVGFPAPIILALMINEVQKNFLKRGIQTIVYIPHFISLVVVVGMILSFLSPSSGIVNVMITALGGESVHFMAEPAWFKTIYVLSGVWQEAGWGCIIYLAALSGIDPHLYESAVVDGASRWQRLISITLPSIVPTIMIMLILRMGGLFSVGFEKIMLMYNPITYETADVISTYVYRRGIQGGEYSFSTAVGLFNSVINLVMLVTFNAISKRMNGTSLW